MTGETTDVLKLRIHFASGRNVDTLVADGEANELIDADEYVEQQLAGKGSLVNGLFAVPGKPRWTWIGDVFVYSQAVEGVEIL